MKQTRFFQQAELVLQILPFFKSEKVFALKGGTAINFFLRNLPRLSVDIDLAYLPINKREIALAEISERLEKVSLRILQQFPKIEITKKTLTESNKTIGLMVKHGNVSVKIEPNFILRGPVFEPIEQRLCEKAEELFEKTMSLSTLSFADLYGGKICAALDRQHPRDLFDIHILLKNEGFTEEIRKAFFVYLISHPRPIIELLNPTLKDLSGVFENEFKGMTTPQIKLDDLIEARLSLLQFVQHSLNERERQFLLSVKQIKPQWESLELQHIKDLPAVQWKLFNLKKMDKTKHQKAVEKLRSFLEI